MYHKKKRHRRGICQASNLTIAISHLRCSRIWWSPFNPGPPLRSDPGNGHVAPMVHDE